MKLMTYNILEGGKERLDYIISAVRNETPDILVINEANDFLANEGEVSKHFSKETNLPYYKIVETERGYDVGIFSKLPFKKTEVLMTGKRAAVLVEVESLFGPVSIVGAHLSTKSEDIRLSEIKLIIEAQKGYRNRIIMGDLNSLSKIDNYSEEVFKNFNEKQISKFTNDSKPRFEITDEIMMSGYSDTADLAQNNETTVPTLSNKDTAHADLRLDYIFLSESLSPHMINYKVVKNEITDKGSDHYPVVVELQ